MTCSFVLTTPTEIIHLDEPENFQDKNGKAKPVALANAAGKTVIRALQNKKGDILVFLPGVAEIRK